MADHRQLAHHPHIMDRPHSAIPNICSSHFSCLLAVTLLGYHNLIQGIGASLAYLITHTASTYIVQSAMNTTDYLC